MGPDAIEESSETVRLPADRWWVDFVEFEKAVSQARWSEAAALYGEPLAVEAGSDGGRRAHCPAGRGAGADPRQATHCFVRLVARALAEGDLSGAERWARTYVVIDPVSESARQLLMQVLHAEDQDTDALASFEEYRTFLDRLIGDDPSVSLYGLARDIREEPSRSRRPDPREPLEEAKPQWRSPFPHPFSL